jgi:hypothetical protein
MNDDKKINDDKIIEKCRVCSKRNKCNLEECTLEEYPYAFYQDSG